LTETYGTFKYAYRYRESLITAISAGFVLVLIGALFIMTPALFNRILDFFNDFDLVRVPNTVLYWPAPARPLIHSVVYTAAERFSFALGVFQIVILALRFGARSPMNKKAETAGNLVFWLGFGYLIRTLLLETTRWARLGWTPMTVWFVFWAAVLMLLGLTLIIRAIILAATLTRRTT
jgi:hypothetical protein